MTDKFIACTAQELKQYLLDLGVQTVIDYDTDRLYVDKVSAPLGFVVPKREGGLVLEPGEVIEVV